MTETPPHPENSYEARAAAWAAKTAAEYDRHALYSHAAGAGAAIAEWTAIAGIALAALIGFGVDRDGMEKTLAKERNIQAAQQAGNDTAALSRPFDDAARAQVREDAAAIVDMAHYRAVPFLLVSAGLLTAGAYGLTMAQERQRDKALFARDRLSAGPSPYL